MRSEYPHNPNRKDAYWNPDLTFEYGGGASYVRVPKRRARSQSTPWPVAWFWQPLRSGVSLCTEHIWLALVLGVAFLPMPAGLRISPAVGRVAKRTMDIIGATLGLLLALPLFLVVPILIKFDSPGPIFYRQPRVGIDRRRQSRRSLGFSMTTERRQYDRRKHNQHGRVFNLLKFRSMVDNAERTCGPVWATKNDPRITRLGRFLRRTRIDEIPQLLNVFVGQMSLVGPRPERPHFVSQFSRSIDAYPRRHQVRPGITGLAQIENGYDATEEDVHKKIQYDLSYIRQWNPMLDMRILMKTVRVVVTGEGAQ